MKKIIIHILSVLICSQMFLSCGKELNERVTLWRNDKIPYGAWYAYHQLPYLFTDAVIETSTVSPVAFYEDVKQGSAYILIGNTVIPSEKEWKAMLNHAIAGNHILISAVDFGQNILDTFQLSLSPGGRINKEDTAFFELGDSGSSSRTFSYPGRKLGAVANSYDTIYTSVLGTNGQGQPNFVRFSYENGGAVYLHLDPAVFTNFFLLHGENKTYYDQVMSVIPDTVGLVRWDEYFRRHVNGEDISRRSAFSKLAFFMNDEVLRWAFWLAVIMLALLYLFESKRRQQAIATVPSRQNTSLDFVRTIGRLYYHRRDHLNLARKMERQFLIHLRSHYKIDTIDSGEASIRKIAYKSGCPVTLVREIAQIVESLPGRRSFSDSELMNFHQKIDTFIHYGSNGNRNIR